MKDISTIDYSALDQPEVLMFLFHPRQEVGLYDNNSTAEDLLIPVENDVEIGARFHMARKAFNNVLFFHSPLYQHLIPTNPQTPKNSPHVL